MMKVSLVVAAGANLGIGWRNTMPWHLRDDLRHFKKITMGHPIIMGRITYESIGGSLPGRKNIIVSSRTDWQPADAIVVNSLPDALVVAGEYAVKADVNELIVIGGAKVYLQALPLSERIYMTEVHAEPECDAFFPELDKQEWKELERKRFEVCEGNSHPFSIVVLERVSRQS